MSRIQVVENPMSAAAAQLSECLTKNASKKILLFLSGGSTLQVLDQVNTQSFGTHITIVMCDDRFTDEPEGNNFLKLTQTSFYKDAVVRGVTVISTAKQSYQTNAELADFVNKSIIHYLHEHEDAYVAGLFGVGPDGHTASIFPMNESPFKHLYIDISVKDKYVPITWEDDSYPLRVTITPNVITDHVDEVVVAIAGEEKCESLRALRNTSNEYHELPALYLLNHKKAHIFSEFKI